MANLLKTVARGLISRDAMDRFRLLRRMARWLTPEYRLKWPQMAWWHDADFTGVIERFGEQGGLNADRRWMIQQLARLAADVEGHTAECGAWRGMGSYLIARVNRAGSMRRTHFVFDSFEGLSEPDEIDGSYWTGGDLAESEETCRRSLAEFGDDVRIHKGWIPDCFGQLNDERFAFVHIDVDLYQPTRDSLEFFYPRLNPGAVVLCDDYGFTSCPGATRAMDEFLEDKPEKAIPLSAGAGFFICGTRTLPAFVPLPLS